MNYAMLLYCVAHGVRRFTEEQMETNAPRLLAYGVAANR
jgi:hypothetical protein